MQQWQYLTFTVEGPISRKRLDFSNPQSDDLVSIWKTRLGQGLKEKESNVRHLELNWGKSTIPDVLGWLGYDGWELVTAFTMVYIFKRQYSSS